MIARRLSHDTQIRLIQASHPRPSTVRSRSTAALL